jgi:hypothetical protein
MRLHAARRLQVDNSWLNCKKCESIITNIYFFKTSGTLRWFFSWNMICSFRSALEEIFHSRSFPFISIPWVTFWSGRDHLLPMLSLQETFINLTILIYIIMKRAVSKFLSFINTNMNPFESLELEFETYAYKTYSVFHRFKQARFACGAPWWFNSKLEPIFLPPQLTQNLMHDLKIVKNDSKIIISLH